MSPLPLASATNAARWRGKPASHRWTSATVTSGPGMLSRDSASAPAPWPMNTITTCPPVAARAWNAATALSSASRVASPR